ncbi:MAG: glycosyltransferase family 87 protein [Pseudomonadota bacterium]
MSNGDVMPKSLRRDWVFTGVLICAIGVVLARFGLAIWGMRPGFAFVDYRYFYAAGVAFAQGLDVYGEAYLKLGQEIFGFFPQPFYYPPSIVPLLAPLALFDPKTGSAVFMALSAGAVLACSVAAAALIRNRSLHVDWRLVAAIVVLGAAVFRPAMSVMVLGNVKVFMLVGLVCWIAGALRASVVLQAVGLAILVMKPQLGLTLGLLALMRPAWRLGAVGAGLLSVGLYLLAAWPFGIFYYAMEYVGNVQSYTGQSTNPGEVLIGLHFFLDRLGLSVGAFATAGICLAAAALRALRNAAPLDPMATGFFAVAVGICAAPSHSNETLALMPVLALAATRGDIALKLVLAVSICGLGMLDWSVLLPGGLGAYATVHRELIGTLLLLAATGALFLLSAREVQSRSM